MARPKRDNIERELLSARIDKSLIPLIRLLCSAEKAPEYYVVEEAIRNYLMAKADVIKKYQKTLTSTLNTFSARERPKVKRNQ